MCNLVATFALQSYGFLSEKQKKKCEKYTIQHYLGPLIILFRIDVRSPSGSNGRTAIRNFGRN